MRGLSEYEKEKKRGSRIVEIQIAATLTATAFAYFYSSSWNIASAIFWGAMTGTLNSLSLVSGLSKIEKKPEFQPHIILRNLYRNSMHRFLIVIFSLFVAMGLLKLSPAAVLCGFVLGQVVPILARILMIKR